MMVCIASLGSVAVIWYGGRMALSGALTVGTIIAFNYYLGNLVGTTRRMSWVVGQVSRALVSAQRIFDILDIPAEIEERPDAVPLSDPKGQVVFDHVSFEFEPGHPVLRDISFTVEPGQVI